MKISSRLSMALGLTFFVLSAAAFAATTGAPIAEVVDVVKEAFHTPPEGEEMAAKIGDRLLPDETIRTSADSAIEISFPDGATLRLEADSDLILDSYVYDPTATKSAAAIAVTSGFVRYATGGVSTDDTGVEFTTPVATVGIRGTDIVISVGAGGVTVIDVLAGKVSAKPKKHDEVAEAEEGQSVLISSDDQAPEVGAIGDFATAAGVPTTGPAPSVEHDPKDREEPAAEPAGPTGNQGGGNEDPGGDGGTTDGDGDGNAGHGNNEGKHDNDNPGNSKGHDND